MSDIKCPTCGIALLEHPANRCLDAWVATAVMGWEKFEVGYFGSDSSPRQNELEEWMDKNEIESVGDYFIDVDKDFWIEEEKWKPSSDISAAWEVVEKMEGDWWKMEFLTGIHAAMFEKPNMKCADQTYHEATADTMSLAICRASLLAVLG